MKSCKNLICYSCIFNVQLHIHLKKWTLKFKLLYLRNCISYFNTIRTICSANTHTKSESLAQIRTAISEIQHFSRGLFFIAAPCRGDTATPGGLHDLPRISITVSASRPPKTTKPVCRFTELPRKVCCRNLYIVDVRKYSIVTLFIATAQQCIVTRSSLLVGLRVHATDCVADSVSGLITISVVAWRSGATV